MSKQSLWEAGCECEKLAEVVAAFEVVQQNVATTNPQSVIPQLRAMRHTIGVVLMDHDIEHPRFAFNRQRNMQNKPTDDYYRLEIVGGGIVSEQQRAVEALGKYDDLLTDPSFWRDGKVPSNFDFLYLGRGLLENGYFPKLRPDMASGSLEELLRAGLDMRMGQELGVQTMQSIDPPVILTTGEPRETHVTVMDFGPLNEQIRQKYNLGWDAKRKKVTGVILTVREYFALAMADFEKLQHHAGAFLEVHTPDSLLKLTQKNIRNADGAADLSVWQDRPSGSLRNSSLLAGVGAALKHVDPSMIGSIKRLWLRVCSRFPK